MAATTVGGATADVGAAPPSSSSSSSFDTLKQCFSRRIDELQELLDLRVDGEGFIG
jgi:hypothetical protein